MKIFYTFILAIQLFCIIASMNKQKAVCVCDKTEPYKCECKECNCANED